MCKQRVSAGFVYQFGVGSNTRSDMSVGQDAPGDTVGNISCSHKTLAHEISGINSYWGKGRMVPKVVLKKGSSK